MHTKFHVVSHSLFSSNIEMVPCVIISASNKNVITLCSLIILIYHLVLCKHLSQSCKYIIEICIDETCRIKCSLLCLIKNVRFI